MELSSFYIISRILLETSSNSTRTNDLTLLVVESLKSTVVRYKSIQAPVTFEFHILKFSAELENISEVTLRLNVWQVNIHMLKAPICIG